MSSQSASLNQRQQLLDRLKTSSGSWQVIVVGGGITGAGIAREAARRGLKTLLVERQDFAWGTSSRSSKMVHGGLRYLASGDVKTTRDSVKERERLIKEAPGLVDEMNYTMVHYKGGFPGPFLFNTMLSIYDVFAGKRYHSYHKAKKTGYFSPLLDMHNVIGASQFVDAVTDDSRLVMRVLSEAVNDGADVLNYVGVTGLLKKTTDVGAKSGQEQVSGVHLVDAITGDEFDVHAEVVINATGAWTDELRSGVTEKKRIRPARGSHILIPGWRLPLEQSYTVIHPQDKRPVFIFPWEGSTVIGTTDLDHPNTDNAEVGITNDELQYLMTLARHQFPNADLSEDDIISTWAGVRPLVSSGASNTSKEKRDHSVWDDKGLVSVSGGKLTTFRIIALDALNVAARYLSHYPDDGEFGQQIFTPVTVKHRDYASLPAYRQKRLTGRYGLDTEALLAKAKEGELEPIPGTRTLWAELRWAAHESIVHLDDLLLRRTRIGLQVEQGGMIYEDKINAICIEELQWDESTWEEEKARYQTLWNQYYSVPREQK